MSRSVQQRIDDILDAIVKCQRYLRALDDDPRLEEMAGDAIERTLQIIGEAVNHLPSEITEPHSEIAWPQIRGIRNILVHQYFGVDIAVVRDVVEIHLPPLAEVLQSHRDEV